jgi:hypothetical protein
MTAYRAPTRTPAWRTVNISPIDRAGRIVLGLATIVASLVLMASAGSALPMVLETLLAFAGADLVITGALGHCPLYAWLGRSARQARAR